MSYIITCPYCGFVGKHAEYHVSLAGEWFCPECDEEFRVDLRDDNDCDDDFEEDWL
jgi:transposase